VDLRLILAATEATDPTTLAIVGSYAWMILSVCLGLGFVIFVHELGHFLVAKACGVKCEKFYIGFDWFPLTHIGPLKIPHALWKAQLGETEYGIGILPLGGYVKMLGQDDDPRNAAAEAERTHLPAADASVTGSGSSAATGTGTPADTARTEELAKATAAEGLVAGTTVEKASQPVALDPRSYPAKSVPARMAIISAGVIMNLIFAVILAAIAYRMGVDEIPAMIGNTVPGDPAWMAALQPGDKIIQFGKSGQPYEQLRFDDLRRATLFNGTKSDLAMFVQHPNGKQEWYDIRPVKKDGAKFATVGIGQAFSTRIGVGPKADADRVTSSVPIENQDVVIAIENQSIASGAEMAAAFAQHPSGPLAITVERKVPPVDGAAKTEKPVTKKIDIVVQPRHQRYFGAVMKMGPIIAIQKGSPAEAAGLKAGDLLETLDGEPIGDPLALNQRLVAKSGEMVKLTALRKEGNKSVSKEFSLAVLPPKTLLSLELPGPTAATGIGIAFRALPVVASVDAGTPAAKASLQPGDEITAVEFVAVDEKSLDKLAGTLGVKPLAENLKFKIDAGQHDWGFVHRVIQFIDKDTPVKLTFTRKGKPETASLTIVENLNVFDDTRGLRIFGEFVNHRAKGWGEAFRLGLRETKERLTEVLTVLSQLGTGKLSATNLSGPAGILYVAGHSASAGIPELLMFLTLLSANLAIINFLPIPALDGGHMLFLAAEWIRGKPVDPNLQGYLSMIGVLCLLSLMVFATVMDIGRFLG
jgi:regulator of sigma E protease